MGIIGSIVKTKQKKTNKNCWKLEKKESCENFRKRLRQALSGLEEMPNDWVTTATGIRETGRDMFGVSSGQRTDYKET